jgi:thiol:disulfide interchange protein
MNIRHLTRILAAVFAGAAIVASAQAGDFPKGSPAFVTNYEAALKASKESGKPVILVFSAAWCGPCQANKKDVYPSAEVKPFHDKFVWAYLDADEEKNMPHMEKYGVTGIPHIQFLSKSGEALGQIVGGSAPGDFAKELEATLKKAGS